MEEAIEIALQNHPRLKVATAEIEKARASKGEIWDGGSTSFSYAWGQLNGEYNKDNEMSIEQSLGSFITPFYKNALVKSQVSTGEYYRNMVKKEIIAEVKRAWTYYQFANSIYNLYKEQDQLAGKLKQSGELRYSQGDIDLTEKNMISAMAANMRTMLLHWQEEVSLAKKRLTWVCYSDIQILPSDDSLAIFQSSDTDLLPSADHLNYFLGKVDEQKKLLQIERSKFFSSFLKRVTSSYHYPPIRYYFSIYPMDR
uniref:TolC family protein n=1 Tax=Bacteroides caecigallinarum TaxID=1411144 RepID=UPI00374D68FA